MTPTVQILHREYKARRFDWASRGVPDAPINLKQLPKGFYLIGEQPKPITIPIIAIESAETVQIVVKPKKPTIQFIIDRVAAYYNITRADIVGASRLARIVLPRQIAIYLCREVLPSFNNATSMMVCGWSMPSLGRKFGGRDHSTIHHAYYKIAALILTDHGVAFDVAHLEAELMAVGE